MRVHAGHARGEDGLLFGAAGKARLFRVTRHNEEKNVFPSTPFLPLPPLHPFGSLHFADKLAPRPLSFKRILALSMQNGTYTGPYYILHESVVKIPASASRQRPQVQLQIRHEEDAGVCGQGWVRSQGGGDADPPSAPETHWPDENLYRLIAAHWFLTEVSSAQS